MHTNSVFLFLQPYELGIEPYYIYKNTKNLFQEFQTSNLYEPSVMSSCSYT